MFSPHKSTVPIFNGDQNVPDLIASGIYVVVDEIKLIITAAHMFEQTRCASALGFRGRQERASILEAGALRSGTPLPWARGLRIGFVPDFPLRFETC